MLFSEEKKSLFFRPSKYDVKVGEGFWNGIFADALYCSSCKKIIVNLDK